MVPPMTFRPIALEDREGMEAIRRAAGQTHSTYTFPVLYAWQKTLGLSVCLWEDAFAVRIASAGPRDYLFPCGAPASVRMLLERCGAGPGSARFHYLSQADVASVGSWYPAERYVVTETPGCADYLARTADLSRLEGGAMRHVRKDILAFRRSGALEQRPIDAGNLDEVLRVTQAWDAACRRGETYADELPLREAIGAYDRLGLSGSLFYRDGVCAAYLIGSELSGDTYDIHFAKCCDRTRGMDYECKHLFFQELEPRYPYVNMEEDMGLPGLRRRKLLLHPCAIPAAYRCDFPEGGTAL